MRGAAGGSCVALFMIIASGPYSTASADDWSFKPAVGLYESFTSNAKLAPPGDENWDFVTDLEPSLVVHGAGGRFTLDLDGSAKFLLYARDRSLSTILPSLMEANTTELIPDLLFIDTHAFVGQQPKNTGQAVSGSEFTGQQGSTTATFVVSPYMRNHFGDFADSQLRYTFSGFLGTSGVGRSMTNSLTETVVSGPQFQRLKWTVTGAASFSQYSNSNSDSNSNSGNAGSRNTYNLLAEVDGEYVIDNWISALAGVGYEAIHDETLDSQPNGPIGLVGVRLTGARMSLVLAFNHRFDSNYPSMDFTYQINPQSQIRASYTEGIDTTASLFANDVSFLSTDAYGNFVDARTSELFSLGNTGLGVQNSAFRHRSFNVSYVGVFDRDSVNASGYFDMRNGSQGQSSETAYGAILGWRHSISPVDEFSASLRFQRTSGGNSDGGTQSTINLGLAYSRQLSDTLTGVALYDFTNRFSSSSSDRFRENVVTVGLKKSF
jgi:uncharacterized protein (PEP-CTERM system associated)